MDKYSVINTHYHYYHYYLKTPPEIDRVDIKHYQKVYDNYIEQLTRDFRNDQDWYKFYRSLNYFIYQVSINFGLTRLGNYILYNYNIERLKYFNDLK